MKDSDYTTMSVGSRTTFGKEIAACPMCSRPGAVTSYGDGSRNYTHRARPTQGRETTLEACLVLPPPKLTRT